VICISEQCIFGEEKSEHFSLKGIMILSVKLKTKENTYTSHTFTNYLIIGMKCLFE